MQKAQKLFAAAVCFVALVVSADNQEPSYQGRTLTEWAKQLDPHLMYAVGHEPAEVLAIRQIGTNAIPTLLKWIASKGPPETGLPDQKHLAPCYFTTPSQRAQLAFRILGEAARPAIPELTEFAMKFRDRERFDNCIEALADIGPASLRSFDTILTKGHPGARWSALTWLPVFHSNAVVVLPAAIKCLVGKDEDVGWKAADELSRLDVPHSILVPALTNAFPSASGVARLRVVRCLLWIGPPARDAVPVLQATMRNSNLEIRNAASNALRYIAPEALKSEPQR